VVFYQRRRLVTCWLRAIFPSLPLLQMTIVCSQ